MDLLKAKKCNCGKEHSVIIDKIIVEKGALNRLPDILKEYNTKKVFILADKNTYKAAGERVFEILSENGINIAKYIFDTESLEPDEFAVGSSLMHFDSSVDIIIGVGSGVINDIGKILSNTFGKKYIIVATAPSMDGYASATSSMSLDGLKVSLNSKCPDVIIGDIDILKEAPIKSMISGLGDMIAKYISIAEWRISNIICGEYYCETTADLVRNAVKKCVDNADALLKRDENAVQTVFEGLIVSGIAMAYVGISRPASGVEHYFSHIWDMRSLQFGTNTSTHGIQCAIGTLYSVKIYDKIRKVLPNSEKALKYVNEFDYTAYKEKLRTFMGKGAETMIALEEKEGKYDKNKHSERLKIIESKWDHILKIIDEEIPSKEAITNLLDRVGLPKTCDEIGIESDVLLPTFKATKDIRDKYILSRLCFDLGIIDEITF